AEAMGDRRFVEPRLTGGFHHARLTVLRSGETPHGLDAESPAVLGAVARIRERAQGDTSPEALGALGVTYLVSGDTGAAVKALEWLSKVHQSSAEDDKARVRAAIEGGQQAIDRLADESPSVLRDYFEDELLPAWADAYLVGRPEASLHREHARLVGEALLRSTCDAMPRDAARALAEPAATAVSRDPLRSQALGYQ